MRRIAVSCAACWLHLNHRAQRSGSLCTISSNLWSAMTKGAESELLLAALSDTLRILAAAYAVRHFLHNSRLPSALFSLFAFCVSYTHTTAFQIVSLCW